jgi:DNA-binding transcriptional regulator YhcF (GntR family)
MTLKEELFNKNGLAVIKLAGTLSRYRSGDRLPRIGDLAKEMTLSVGTVQSGLNFLREKKAVSVNPRGHMGTYLEAINYDRLQEYAGTALKTCVMPLPYSLRYEGLASAFSELGSRNGKMYLAFMNGSCRRIKAMLEGRYDCVLVSRLAAEQFIKQGMRIEIAASYGPLSFLETHVLVHRTKTAARIKTIGLDRESLDQTLLSKSFLADHPKVKIKNMAYVHIIRRLLAGEVDATLWNLDYIKEHHPSLQCTPLSPSPFQDALTEAVLAVRKDDAAAADFLARRFPKQKVLKIQDAVLCGRRIPEY